jgi:hypothetical protein
MDTTPGLETRVKRFCPAVAVAGLLGASVAHADGFVPPHPYHYLHPPPALARSNKPPTGVNQLLPAANGRSVGGFTHFTADGQAGLGGHSGVFSVPAKAKYVDLRIRPVNPPVPLPRQYSLDGNAYETSATASPGGQAARVNQKLGLVLRWAQLPHAILVYTGHHWRVLCDVTSPDWQIDALVVVCHTTTLGTFAAARRIYR